MKLSTLYDPRLVVIDLAAETKEQVFTALADRFLAAGRITGLDGFLADLRAREASFSTGVGEGLAIPHAKSAEVPEASYAIATLATPFLWDEDDDEPTTLIVMLAVPAAEAGTTHLQLLSQLSIALMDTTFRRSLADATSEQDIRTAIERNEKEED